MKLKYPIIIICLIFSGCGIVKINFNSQPSSDITEKNKQCEECKIQPVSGSHRDLKYGFYFDIKDKNCKMITYSTGPGYIPPPFITLEQCKACCE
jgi:hypothetical protein